MVQTELYAEPEEEVVLGSYLVRSCETVDQSRVKKRQKVKIQLQILRDRDEIVISERCFRVLLPKRVPHEIETNQQDKKWPMKKFLL